MCPKQSASYDILLGLNVRVPCKDQENHNFMHNAEKGLSYHVRTAYAQYYLAHKRILIAHSYILIRTFSVGDKF